MAMIKGPAPSFQSRFSHLLPSRQALLLIILLNAFILVLGGLALLDSYHQARERAVQSAQDLSMTLAEGVGGLLDRIDFALLGIGDDVTQNPTQMQALLSGWRRRVPEIQDFWVVGPDGRPRFSGQGERELADVDLSDRDYFSQLRDGSPGGMAVSKPVVGRVTQQWMIILARRINMPDGKFAGVVLATLPVSTVASLFSSLHLGRDGAVSLRAADLSVMARYPETIGKAAAVGKTAVSKELTEAVRGNPLMGNYLAKAGIDGIERALSYHKIGSRPVYVVVGLATSDTMSEWRRGAMPLVAGLAAFLLLTLLGGATISRIWRQRVEAHDSLRAMLAEKERFSEILAHHLQEPVRIQHIFAQRLKALLPEPLSEDVAVSLDHVLRGATRLRALLRDVRTYLNLDEMLGGPAHSCDAEAALAQLLQGLEPKLQAAQAQMEVGELPLSPLAEKPFTILMRALIENAVEHRSSERAPLIRIGGGVVAEGRGSWVYFAVTDNGQGIPVTYRERVFNVFERLNPNPEQSGTGIGLAIVRKIAQGAGGSAVITDGDDGGIKVTVYFPATPAA